MSTSEQGHSYRGASEPRPTLEELRARKERTRQRVQGDAEVMTVSMGPQHPSTHGVFRADLDLDGEIIVATRPEIGNLHRGVEKLAESLTYHQIIPLTDRLHYVASFAQNHGYCEAVEKLMGIEAPPRGRYIRVLLDEMCRVSNHLLWLGIHIMDFGAITFQQICFREREYLMDLFEMMTGARLTHSFCRIGGVAKDVPDGFDEKMRAVLEIMPKRIAEYERLIDQNRIFLKRAKQVGIFTSEDCAAWRITGPALRAAGVTRDLRRDEPYAAYPDMDFEVCVEYEADVYARYRVRMREMRESLKIIRQCLDNMPAGDFISTDAAHVLPRKKDVMRSAAAMVQDFVQVFHGPAVPAGEVYRAIETPHGELGFYVVSDGGPKPQRLRITTPCYYHCQATPALFEGEMLADIVGIFGSVDVCLGSCDR
jgi:NADH-quinone oxidoreductase subunit D